MDLRTKQHVMWVSQWPKNVYDGFVLTMYEYVIKQYSSFCKQMLAIYRGSTVYEFKVMKKINENNMSTVNRKYVEYRIVRHSASLGRFVPHHASAVWRKAPLHRTLFRLNLEKKMAAPISMLTSSTIDGCDFYNPLQLFGNSKTLFYWNRGKEHKREIMYRP